MLRKFRNSMIILCVFALTFLSLGIITLMPTPAKASPSLESAIAEFAMENGAAIRKGSDKQGIRFNAILSESTYTTLKDAGAEFGMLIVPKDYVDEGYDLTVENVFGNNAVYVPNVSASSLKQTNPDKRAIIQISRPTISFVEGVYKIYGSIVSVLPNNIPRGFIGRAYLKINDTYYLADYANDLVDNNTRSMAYIAQTAINNSDVDSATLQTNYVDKVKDETFDYTVNKVTIKLDGTTTTEVLTQGKAKFGTAIKQNAENRFGVESFGVDSFVGMQNAKFNVVYRETPVDVVVDADASATELYAANELASYIEQVTGKAVYVGVQRRTTNNIYVSTDTSLNLNMDSFKLSTDANGNIHINGTDDRGTLYGVYEYEEENLGIKFLSETYTHVPVTNEQIPTLSESQKTTYSPAFNYRTYMNNSIGLDGEYNVKYSSHLRFIAQFSQEKSPTELMSQVQYFMPWMAKPWLISSHSLVYYAAIGAHQLGRTDLVDVSLDANGEYTSIKFNQTAFDSEADGALDNGQNILDVCYSSDLAREWVAAGLKYIIDTYGNDYEFFMLGQADKTTECDCSTCKKAIVSSISNLWNPKKNKADLTATFIKDVVTTVNGYGVSKCGENYSDNNIVMFAYQKTEPAPKNEITDMPDNVYIQWAPIDQDRYFPLSNANPSGWTEKTGIDKFMVWSYEVDFGYYFNYYPTMHNWIANFQTYKELGVEAVMMQSSWNTSGVADSYLDAYVASKLLWNFKVNSQAEMQAIIDSAKEEFIQYFYGDAAKDLILQYYNDFDALYESKFSSNGYLNSGDRTFEASDLNHQLDLINQAIAKTTDESHLTHLKMLAFTPRYMLVQYCEVTDTDLLNDMNEVGVTRSREGYALDDDANLDGFIKFKKGATEVIAKETDENGRIIHLTLEIPDNQEWTSTTASFTADYVNSLYEDNVRTIQMYSSSTANIGQVIYTYGENTVNYECQAIENVEITAGGEEFRFCYVDVNGSVHGEGGYTIGTTLDLYFNYLTEDQRVQDEIGMTLGEDVRIFKHHVDGSYVIANANSEVNSAYFDASIVNDCISQGYKAVKITTKFTPNDKIDQVVGYDTASKTNNSGYSEWTFFLTQDTPIKFWAQKDSIGNNGAFNISNIELLTDVEPYQANYAKPLSRNYDENGRLSQLVVEIPDGTEWWVNNPVINADYLNDLYAQGVKQVIINAISTVDTNNFFTMYNDTSTETLCAKVNLVANSTDLRFSYVNLNAGGVTVGTTLTLNFTYSDQSPEDIAAELGITLANGAEIMKDGDAYVISNASAMMQAYFSAEKVNEWIAQGYEALSFNVSFTASGTITRVIYLNGISFSELVAWGEVTQTSEIIFDLTENMPIQLWAQNGDYASNDPFTVSNVKFIRYNNHVSAGYATISNCEYDEYGRIVALTAQIPAGNEWWTNTPTLTAKYLNKLYADGIGQIRVTASATNLASNNFYTQYGTTYTNTPTCIINLVENGGEFKFSFLNESSSGGYTIATTMTLSISYLKDIGITIPAGATIANGNTDGSYVISNTRGIEYAASFSAETVNTWIARGYEKLSVTVAFTASDSIDQVVGYSASNSYVTSEVPAGKVLTFTLKEGEEIKFWTQKSGNVTTNASFTLSNITFEYSQAYIASEIGVTLRGVTTITKNGDGSYDIYDTRGADTGLEFTAAQVNAWLDQGYTTISFALTFTPVENVIDETVVYSATTGYIENFDNADKITITLARDTAIYIWSQANHAGQPGATFTISNVTLA